MVNPYPHPILAREGWPFIAAAFLVAIAATFVLGFWFALVFWVIAWFVTQFFRDPPRNIPAEAGAVLSPADGRIIKVERATDPYQQCESLKISVFMNVFNVHSNRIPIDGKVVSVDYKAGAFVNADLDKASEQNERNALVLERSDGVRLTCVQVAGLIARRILCYVSPGDSVSRGSRFGFIRFGSRVDVYLPLGAEPAVSIGDKVSASSTVLATLPSTGDSA
ncbi:MAG: phosphatidylserine decarboxylase [Burkholderiaceae bacterium]